MKITKIVSSLTFLASLSMAVVASENDKLKSGESLSQKRLSYITKTGETVIYSEEEYEYNLNKVLNERNPFYTDIYDQQFDTKEDKKFIVNFNSTIISYCVGTISMMASGSIGAFFSSGIISFAITRSLGEFFIVRSPMPRHSYNDAKSALYTFAKNDLYDKGYLPATRDFPLESGYSLFNSSMNKITTPSTVSQ